MTMKCQHLPIREALIWVSPGAWRVGDEFKEGGGRRV
jgi:hypothetical protein